MTFFGKSLRATMVVLGIGINLLMVSCTSGLSTTRFLVEQPDRAVGMEVTYREGSPEYSHPATLTAERLDQVLQHLEVEPSSLLSRITGGSATTQEAFSGKQRRFLANHLSTALHQATPLETVTFSWATPRGNGIWELTSGGMYLLDDDLHLVLPNYRQTVATKNPPQRAKNEPLAQIGESLHSLKAIDPAQQLTHGLASELWSPQTPHFVFPVAQFSETSMTSGGEKKQPANPSPNSGESIKQRLQILEELRQEGLLSEEEYQRKRQDILEGL